MPHLERCSLLRIKGRKRNDLSGTYSLSKSPRKQMITMVFNIRVSLPGASERTCNVLTHLVFTIIFVKHILFVALPFYRWENGDREKRTALGQISSQRQIKVLDNSICLHISRSRVSLMSCTNCNIKGNPGMGVPLRQL